MSQSDTKNERTMPPLSRRRMLQLIPASVALGALGSRRAFALQAADEQTTLRAFNRTIEVNGKPARVLGIEQADGTWGLTGEKGERFQVKLINERGNGASGHYGYDRVGPY